MEHSDSNTTLKDTERYFKCKMLALPSSSAIVSCSGGIVLLVLRCKPASANRRADG